MKILTAILVALCLHTISPAYGQTASSDVLHIKVYRSDGQASLQTLRVIVGDGSRVPHSDLEWIESHIISEGYLVFGI